MDVLEDGFNATCAIGAVRTVGNIGSIDDLAKGCAGGRCGVYQETDHEYGRNFLDRQAKGFELLMETSGFNEGDTVTSAPIGSRQGAVASECSQKDKYGGIHSGPRIGGTFLHFGERISS